MNTTQSYFAILPVDEPLGSFRDLTMTNSAAMNTLVYVFCAGMPVGYITMSPKQMNAHIEWKVPEGFPV